MSLKGANYPKIRPSLELRFAQTKTLDPRITFSRASVGTYYDVNGVLRTAPAGAARFDHNPTTGESLGLLVEEARTNEITVSIPTTKILWTVSSLTSVITNAATAPDGAYTATLVAADYGNTGNAYVSASFTTIPTNCTVSFFTKDNGVGGCSGLINTTNGQWTFSYNFSTGAPSYSGGYVQEIKVVNLPNGWRRVSISISGTSTTYVRLNARTYWGGTHPNGNSSTGVYFWGVQVEAGSFPTSYIPTPATFTSRSTTATYYDANGVIQTAGVDVARSNAYLPDANGAMQPIGLLLEGAGTNLATYSEAPTNWAFNNSSGVLDTTVITPDGTTGSILVTFTTSGSNDARLHTSLSALSAGTTYTISVWARMQSGSGTFRIGDFGNNVFSSYFSLTTTWKRYSYTYAPATSATGIYFPFDTSGLMLWGLQVEASPYPTSYIPTSGSTVTRAADVSSSATATRSADVAQITGTNFSSWYNQSQGTTFVHMRKIESFEYSTAPFIAYNGQGNIWDNLKEYGLRYYGSNMTVQAAIRDVSAGDFSFQTPGDVRSETKAVIALNATQFAYTRDGLSVETAATSGPMSTITQLLWHTNGNPRQSTRFSRIAYYPVRLPDATLQRLTT